MSASFLSKMNPEFRPEMAGLSDSLTIGIVLILVFGAAAFYLYSRMTQNEKRLNLLENLLLTLKISTEASLLGPDSVEPVSSPSPLESHDVDEVNEDEYADILKSVSTSAPTASANDSSDTQEEDAEKLLRSLNVEPKVSMNVNYESMSLKELQAHGKERGLPSSITRKKELIEALKKSGPAPAAPTPLVPSSDDLDGSEKLEGFAVNLDEC
jgi:hypothetical protein